MSTTGRITLTAIAKLKPGDTLWDADIKGFGARCRATATTYVYKTRINGRQEWVTIGKHGSPWSPETARKQAIKLAAEAASGINAAEIKRSHRSKPTLAELADEFLRHHGKKIKPRTLADYRRLIRTHLIPKLGKSKIDGITRAQIARAHADWGDTPRTANHALAVLSKMMNWCADHGYIPENSNPCRRIAKYKENARERYLSHAEIARLSEILTQLEQADEESPYVIAAIRLLLLTGARLSEITTLKWDYVDLNTASLRLPDSKTGKKVIRLNTQAVEILTALPRLEGNPYVIVGRRDGAHVINLQKPWRRIRAKVGLDDVRIHDLRHSFASILINSGASLAMVGKLLGHTRAETTARYAHLADAPLRALSEEVGKAFVASPRKSEPSATTGESDRNA